MLFSLGAGQELGNIIVAESRAQSEWARVRTIRLGLRRLQDLIQPDPQRGVNDLLERLAEFGCALLRLSRDVGIQG